MAQVQQIKDDPDNEGFDKERFEKTFIKPLLNKETFEASQGQW
jgi:hypothetical protein